MQIGQLVVCVDDQNFMLTSNRPRGAPIVKGRIYTISGVEPDLFDEPCVQIEEVPDMAKYNEWFLARRFRPLDPKRLDVFRKELTNVKQNEPA